MDDKDTKEFRFGNEKFGGSYKPGEFELKFPNELSSEEFENMFKERLESLHKIGREFIPFKDEIKDELKSKKAKLKPFSIRVKPRTKAFFKSSSILSPREVLEIYENYTNGSEAFIDSLVEDEKKLEQQLAEIQEKLHNARLFKEKLNNLDINNSKQSDDEIISSLSEEYENSQIKAVSTTEEIIADIELYNTQKIIVDDCETIKVVAANDVIPVIYFISCASSDDEPVKVLSEIKQYCSDEEIEFVENNSPRTSIAVEDDETEENSEDGEE